MPPIYLCYKGNFGDCLSFPLSSLCEQSRLCVWNGGLRHPKLHYSGVFDNVNKTGPLLIAGFGKMGISEILYRVNEEKVSQSSEWIT